MSDDSIDQRADGVNGEHDPEGADAYDDEMASDVSESEGDDAHRLSIGVDLGGTNIQAGIINEQGEVLGHAKVRTDAEKGFEKVLDRVAAACREACDDAGVKMSMIHTAGIGVPGPIDPDRGIVVEAVNLRWTNAPVVLALSERIGVPVYADNDVNVAVYGEWRAGIGRNRSNLLGVWVGTGVGGGLIINSRLHRGAYNSAGEMGHMIIHPGAHLGSRSVEHNCSRTAIVHELVKLIKANRQSMLPSLVDGKMHKIKSKVLALAYEQGDDLVRTVINDSADLLGMAIANIVTLLSLDMVVLGGGLVDAIGKPYVDIVRDAVRREAFPESLRGIRVEASVLGDDAGIVGAGLMALEEHWK